MDDYDKAAAHPRPSNPIAAVGTFIYQSGLPATFEFSQRMDHLPSAKGAADRTGGAG